MVRWDAGPVQDARDRSPGLPGLGIALAGYLVGVALSLVILVLLWVGGHPGGRVVQLVASEMGLWVGLLGACFLVSRRRGSGSLKDDFGLRFLPIDVGLGLAASLVARMLAGFSMLPVSFAFRHLRQPDRTVLGDVAHGALGWLVLGLVVCVGAPIIEELFFRGLVQVRLVGRWGPVRGIIVAALLFGAAHLIGWQGPVTLAYALGIFAGGLVLGTARHYSGRLGTSISAHMFFNAQALLVLALVR
jgi:membrane protease YdiL (CAAX protease family)